MSKNTSIEWCDHSFNPWMGCTRVSPGCDNCYAAVSTPARAMKISWGPNQRRRRTAPSTWKQPQAWNKAHEAFFAAHGRRQRVFCASLADVFDNEVPQEWRDDLFRLIEKTPNLDWLLLTKRIGNVGNMLPVPFDFERLYPNVWLGATIVNQEEADRDIQKLLATPARVRFLSMEPLLGPVSLPRTKAFGLHGFGVHKPGVDWVIAGGESGPGARPSHPDWFYSLRNQCASAGVPFHFKQWGEWGPTTWEAKRHVGFTDDGVRGDDVAFTIFGYPPHQVAWPVIKIGKKAAGRLLDGAEHNGFPEVA